MAKKQSGDSPDKSRRSKKVTTTTRIEVDLLRMAKTVAAFRNADLIDYLESILRSVVQRDYDLIIRKEDE